MKLVVAQRKVTRIIEENLQKVADLSVPELSVLGVLSDAEGNRLRLRDLCVALGWDRSRTSHQVTRMQRRGLVAKGKCSSDARGVFVRSRPGWWCIWFRIVVMFGGLLSGPGSGLGRPTASICRELSRGQCPAPGLRLRVVRQGAGRAEAPHHPLHPRPRLEREHPGRHVPERAIRGLVNPLDRRASSSEDPSVQKPCPKTCKAPELVAEDQRRSLFSWGSSQFQCKMRAGTSFRGPGSRTAGVL
nr:helix-turn-helix domain-containing protein [Corynebacterium timonense]